MSLQYFQENKGDEVDIFPSDKLEIFLQVDCITLGVHSQQCPKYRNENFAISLQYHKENVKNEVDFLPAVNHQKFIQIDNIILGVCSQACPNCPK